MGVDWLWRGCGLGFVFRIFGPRVSFSSQGNRSFEFLADSGFEARVPGEFQAAVQFVGAAGQAGLEIEEVRQDTIFDQTPERQGLDCGIGSHAFEERC